MPGPFEDAPTLTPPLPPADAGGIATASTTRPASPTPGLDLTVAAPASGVAPDLDRTAVAAADADKTISTPALAASGFNSQTRIGTYTVVGRLGEGGMGVVYEAVQENPRRRVALKVIRGIGPVDGQAVRMFQREAQVLGRLRHPGIAAIYESGATADGQHFLAMELIQGARLDQYLELVAPLASGRLAVRRRLELFLQICDAVSYAHQRGVIHRDLKPGNILVQVPETGGVAGAAAPAAAGLKAEIKVLDFGLARLAEDEFGGVSLATQPGTIQGTVPYMSPEQVRGSTDQVDVRSDVYALGVILYELLAGELPYDLKRVSLPEAARIICEQPPRPLHPRLAGRSPLARELAIIVGKALEKEPDRRYQSVAALAEDVYRCLHDQPILAQSPSTMVQVRKLVARHKFGFAAICTVVVLLAGFAVTMAIDAQRIAAQRDRADREAQVANQVSGFLINLFETAKPDKKLGKNGRSVTVGQLLAQGAQSIQSNRTMDPEVRASLLDTMGSAFSSLGNFARSKPLLEAALATRTALFGAHSLPVAATLRDLGVLAGDRGDEKTAIADYQRALAIYQQRQGPANAAVAKLLNDLGDASSNIGRLDAAQGYFARSLAINAKLDGPNSPKVIPMRNNLAYIAYTRQDYAAAEHQFRQALSLAQRVYGPYHPDVSAIANNLGGVLYTEKKYAAAEHYYTQALALDRRLLGNRHPDVGMDLANLAEAQDAEGHLAQSAATYRQAQAILAAKVAPTDQRLRFVETNLGSVLVRIATPAAVREAEPLLRAAVAADRNVLPAGAWDTADAESELGGCLLAERRYAAAAPLLVGALPTLRAKLGANDPAVVTRAERRLVRLFTALRQPAAAARYRALLTRN
jgi:serine/threonine protein kinase/Tfp pilus assembly protein PilF